MQRQLRKQKILNSRHGRPHIRNGHMERQLCKRMQADYNAHGLDAEIIETESDYGEVESRIELDTDFYDEAESQIQLHDTEVRNRKKEWRSGGGGFSFPFYKLTERQLRNRLRVRDWEKWHALSHRDSGLADILKGYQEPEHLTRWTKKLYRERVSAAQEKANRLFDELVEVLRFNRSKALTKYLDKYWLNQTDRYSKDWRFVVAKAHPELKDFWRKWDGTPDEEEAIRETFRKIFIKESGGVNHRLLINNLKVINPDV